MNLLAIDTSMQACSAAVLATVCHGDKGGDLIAEEIYEEIGSGHAERLFPMIDEVLTKAGIGVADLQRIAVTTGPGNFTGVRIGLAAARGLALARGLDMVALNTLQVLAAAAPSPPDDTSSRLTGVVVDARRNQVYFQLFEAEESIAGKGALLLPPEEVEQMLPTDKRTLLIGSGSEIVAMALSPQARKLIDLLPPPATDFAQPHALVLARLAQGADICTEPPSPLYLRPPDAKIQSGYAIEKA